MPMFVNYSGLIGRQSYPWQRYEKITRIIQSANKKEFGHPAEISLSKGAPLRLSLPYANT